MVHMMLIRLINGLDQHHPYAYPMLDPRAGRLQSSREVGHQLPGLRGHVGAAAAADSTTASTRLSALILAAGRLKTVPGIEKKLKAELDKTVGVAR